MNGDNPFAAPECPAPQNQGFREQLEPPQQVTYVALPDDHLAFVSHLNRTDPTVKRVLRRRMVIMLLVAGGFVFLSNALGPDGAGIEPLGVLFRGIAVGFAILAVLSGPLARWRSRRGYARSIRLGLFGSFDDAIVATIEQGGFRTLEKHGESLRYWPGIHRVAATDQHLFIYQQPAMAIVVPMRAFRSEAEFRGWCDLADRLWRKAQEEETETASD